MRSLFARIWLSYVLVVALTLGAALAVAFGIALKRAEETDRLSTVALTAAAQATLSAKGVVGLDSWLIDQRHAHPEVHIYLVDQAGRELLDRTVSGKPIASASTIPPPVLVSPNGERLRMYVRRTSDLSFGFWQITMKPYLLVLIGVLVSGAGCAWLAHYLTRPVVRLREGVRAIAAGDLETRMGPDLSGRSDELGGLARDFDQMAADLRSMIASKEGLLRDISHELRSPLARLRVAAGLARRDAPPDSEPAFDRIDREVERLDALIGQILRFSRLEGGPAPMREPVDLAVLLQDAVEDAKIEAQAAGKSIDLTLNGGARVVGDYALLRSAVENVLRNAVRFAPDGSSVEVLLDAGQAGARIAICDRGPGLAESDLVRIFEPFVRVESTGGVGLGLAIARRVLELHQGRIGARNRAQGGLVVELFLAAQEFAEPAHSHVDAADRPAQQWAVSASGE